MWTLLARASVALTLPWVVACADCSGQALGGADAALPEASLSFDGGSSDAWSGDVEAGDAGDARPDAAATNLPLGALCLDDLQCQSAHCVEGRCVVCQQSSDCADARLCIDWACVEGCPPGDRCELGGSCCPAGQDCVNGRCLASCGGARCGVDAELCCGAGELCQSQRCVPDCGSDELCGANLDQCCGTGQRCFRSTCIDSGLSCQVQDDCAVGQSCVADLGQCVDDAVIGQCLYHPPIGMFEPTVEWSWQSSAFAPAFDQIMMAPVVANLSDDNSDGVIDQHDIPDVVFITFQPSNGTYNSRGVLRVVSGDGSGELLSVEDRDFDPGSCPAIADLDLDGEPEIVADRVETLGLGTYAVHADGSLYWEKSGAGCGTGGPAIANLNATPQPEVITCQQVLDYQGNTLCTFPKTASLPVAADIDLDGVNEVVTGGGVFRAEADSSGGCVQVFSTGRAGNVAVADFTGDGYPEIVFPADGVFYMYDWQGSQLWASPIPIDLPRIEAMGKSCPGDRYCNPGGGAPTVADFDGDGAPEIGLAARWYYLVFETDGSVLWAHKTQDYSSAVTGSSVFDFDGDGKAEVVYNDELYLRVYRGDGATRDADNDGFLDAEILLELANPSGTLYEYPLVVDVDADGRAEIVLAANNYVFAGNTGLRVFGDARDNWVGTRRIWNQHSYHVTNICDGAGIGCLPADNVSGRAPTHEIRNWEQSWLNNFRQNVQGEGVFWAPDLVIENLAVMCSADGEQLISFDLVNQGSRMTGVGVPVSLYVDGRVQATLTSSVALQPGQREALTYRLSLSVACASPLSLRVVADDDGSGAGARNECENGGEDNNASAATLVACRSPDLVGVNLRLTCTGDGGYDLEFDVHNQGDVAVAAGVPLHVDVDGAVVTSWQTSQGLLPGESEHFRQHYVDSTGGCAVPSLIRLWVDDDAGSGVISECAAGAESNNVSELGGASCETPDLQIREAAAQCLVDSVLGVQLTFELFNAGPAAVADGVPISIFVSGTPLHQMRSTQVLRAGQSERLSWFWELPGSWYDTVLEFVITADLDAGGDGEVLECGGGAEDNNNAEVVTFCSSGG